MVPHSEIRVRKSSAPNCPIDRRPSELRTTKRPNQLGRPLSRGRFSFWRQIKKAKFLTTIETQIERATSKFALAAITQLATVVARKDLTGSLAHLAGSPPPFDVTVHRLYNPESITQYNIVPGLMGGILTMTMVMMTGLAITRERERGTMENLLAMPLSPLEVMTGKIVPYIAIGLIQSAIILLAARFIFNVPFVGSLVTFQNKKYRAGQLHTSVSGQDPVSAPTFWQVVPKEMVALLPHPLEDTAAEMRA